METTNRNIELKVGDTAYLEGKEVKILDIRRRSAVILLKEDGLKKVVLKRHLVSKSDYVMNNTLNQLK